MNWRRNAAMGLLLESCFPSIEAVARHHYLGLPVHWLLGRRSGWKIGCRISPCPSYSCGDRDDIIPIALGQRAYAAAKRQKELYVVQGADHNDIAVGRGRAYFATLSAFIASDRPMTRLLSVQTAASVFFSVHGQIAVRCVT